MLRTHDKSLYTEFISALESRIKMKLPPIIQEQLEFEQYIIKKQHDPFFKQKKKKKIMLTEQYASAFKQLNKFEQIELYKVRIKVLTAISNKNFPKPPQNQSKSIGVLVRGATLRSWKEKQIQVHGRQTSISLRVHDKSKVHKLRNYIYRRSKNTQYESFVLEAINSIPKSKYSNIHIGFTNINQFHNVYQQIKQVMQYAIALNYAEQMGIIIASKQIPQSPDSQQQSISPKKSSIKSPQKQSIKKNIQPQPNKQIEIKRQQKSLIIEQIIKQTIDFKKLQQSNIDDQINIPDKITIFDQLLPEYDINSLFSKDNMTVLESKSSYQLLQDNNNKKRFKIQMTLSEEITKAFISLSNIQSLKMINSQIEEINVKNIIRSQNTGVIYMKLKNYSAIYRGRDFLFLRHIFKSNQNYFIVDKSIQNIDYPPFITIVRGSLTSVWCLSTNQSTGKNVLYLDTTIDNEGILNEDQNTNLSRRYLSKYSNFQLYLREKIMKKQQFQCQLFDVDWTVKSFKQQILNKILGNSKSPTIDKKQQIISIKPALKQNQEIFVPMQNIQQKGQQQLIQINNWKTWIPQLDSKGNSITNWNCLKTNFKLYPWNDTQRIDKDWKQHHIWKGQWKHDNKDGGLWYIDEVRMNAQKKVLGYIVKKMGTNLLQGKGIMNISLPVDIFSTQSNLQRLVRTFVYAPLILQPASKMEDPIEQLKQVIKISFTHSILYGGMQKPFNPVLGETFQGSINGCPIYAQQISHHPPIAAFYFVGRGYKIYGCIQSKMNIGVNTGTGRNDGDIVIQFDNGNIVKFRTPSGQISGLTYGDRKLNLTGKTHYWSPNNQLILELSYNPDKKGLISFGKQKTPSDYFQGTIKKVKKQFMQKFEADKNNTKVSPTDKDTLKQYSKVQGYWTNQIIIDQKTFFNVNQQQYLQFDYQTNQLPSDANYRQDIIYRRLNNIARSQNEKQKIEVKQRQDRKLRQKYGKSHH